MIKNNAKKYVSYPSFMKEESEIEYHTRFPRITICLNSMHSLTKIRKYYPELLTNKSGLFDFSPLSAYYG